VPNASAPTVTVPTDPKEINKILHRAQNGDETTLPVLRELLKQPGRIELFGNLANHVENGLISRFPEKNIAVREAVRLKLDSMRAELAGPTPTPLERMLAEQIATCWLHLHYLECCWAGHQENMRLALGTYYQRCISAAQKRYLAAIKTLATVRRLALPVLIGQVNIAGKQLNKVAMPAQEGQRPATLAGSAPVSGNERE
jgi:hypothetical protein